MQVQRRFTRYLAAGVVGLLAMVGVGWGTASPVGAWPPWAPFPTASAFVTAQYEDFLDRPAGSYERTLWEDRLVALTHVRGDVVASLRSSSDNTTYVDPTARLYMTALVRLPDHAGFAYWVDQRRTGAMSSHQVADLFVTTTEYAAQYGGTTDAQFVTRLYLNVYGHTNFPNGIAYWVSELGNGVTRATVLRRFGEASASKEVLRVDVDISVNVMAMFHRSPTSSDITAFEGDAGDPVELADEFFQHADYHYP